MVDLTLVKKALSRFASGITVVTARDGGEEQHGMTCSAFCSVSLHPPTVLVSLTKKSRTEELVTRSGAFVVNILAEDQIHVSDRFAGRHKDKETDRFDGIACSGGVTGAPILAGTQAHFECRVSKTVDFGDHTIFFGEVVEARVDESRDALLHFGSRYRKLEREV